METTRGPRWPCIARLITRQVSSQLTFGSREGVQYTSYQVSSQLAFCLGEEVQIVFQDGSHGGHLGFPIRTVLAIFDLQVILILPTQFQVNWPLASKEVQYRFSRLRLLGPSWISDRNDFCYFDLQIAPILPTKF